MNSGKKIVCLVVAKFQDVGSFLIEYWALLNEVQLLCHRTRLLDLTLGRSPLTLRASGETRKQTYNLGDHPAIFHSSLNSTVVPRSTRTARSRTSQLVRRMQPWDSVLPIFSGSAVPWMP